MSEERQTDITPQDPEIPDERPEAGGGESQIPDQPMGVQPDMDTEETPLPGLPENEPPQAD